MPGRPGDRSDIWRLDISVLQDSQALREVQDAVAESLALSEFEPCGWDSLKEEWRGACIRAGRRKREREAANIKECLRRIRIVRLGGSQTPEARAYLQFQRERYSRLLCQQSRTAVSSAAHNRPISNPDVLRLARDAGATEKASTHVTSVFREDGEESSERRDIERMFWNFFSDLFSCENSGMGQEFVERVARFSSVLPRLDDEEAQSIIRPITSSEVWEVLHKMNTGATPGTDGIPVEFYRAVWPHVQHALVATLNSVLSGDFTPRSFGRGRIILLPKPDADRRNPSAWRPITLLNVDYKILTALLVARVNRFLSKLISPNQFCSVPGRSIFAPLTLIRDLIAYTSNREGNGIMVSVDQEKAFDRLEHAYLFTVLAGYNFPAGLTTLLRQLYATSTADILLNGVATPSFPVTRGVRQGCPLSPVLFALAIYTLLRRVQDSGGIRGLPLPGAAHVKIVAYADDITLLLRDTVS